MTHLKNLCSASLYNDKLQLEHVNRRDMERDHQLMADNRWTGMEAYGISLATGQLIDSAPGKNPYLDKVLKSHAIGFGEEFTAIEARFIVNARILSWAAGGTGISLKSIDSLLEQMQYINFAPPMPKYCSHLSGDAIPAAHLLSYYLDFSDTKETFPRTDILPFISGRFVQLGYSASLMSRIDKVWTLYLYSTLVSTVLFESNNSNFEPRSSTYSAKLNTLLDKFSSIHPTNKAEADIWAVYSIPGQMQGYLSKAQDYADAISSSLGEPSNNVLFAKDSDAHTIAFQANYSGFGVVGSTFAMINAVKLLMESVVQRTLDMLSGKVKDVPVNTRLEKSELGLTELPKLMVAIEEKVTIGMLPASASNAQSAGSNDLWNNDFICTTHLESILDSMITIIKMELYAQHCIYEKIHAVKDRVDKLHEHQIPFNTKIFARYQIDGEKSLHDFMDFVDEEYAEIILHPFYSSNSLLSTYTHS